MQAPCSSLLMEKIWVRWGQRGDLQASFVDRRRSLCAQLSRRRPGPSDRAWDTEIKNATLAPEDLLASNYKLLLLCRMQTLPLAHTNQEHSVHSPLPRLHKYHGFTCKKYRPSVHISAFEAVTSAVPADPVKPVSHSLLLSWSATYSLWCASCVSTRYAETPRCCMISRSRRSRVDAEAEAGEAAPVSPFDSPSIRAFFCAEGMVFTRSVTRSRWIVCCTRLAAGFSV